MGLRLLSTELPVATMMKCGAEEVASTQVSDIRSRPTHGLRSTADAPDLDQERENDTIITSASVNNTKIDRLLEDLDNTSQLLMPAGCAWSGPFAVLALAGSPPSAGSSASSPTLVEDGLLDFENIFDASDEYLFMTPRTPDCRQQDVSDKIAHDQKASDHPSLGLTGLPLEYSNDFDGLSFSVVRTLLNHYQQSVVELYTPALPSSESPWKVLYLPKVLGCIGEIMLSGDGPHVMMCLLFSILATSAYGMQVLEEQGSSQNNAYQDLGRSFAIKAKSRLKLALAQISAYPSANLKYKDYLVALLSMVTIGVSVYCPHHQSPHANDVAGL